MDQALQPLVVAAHVKAMTHMQKISCESEAVIKILWNTLSISHAAHIRCRGVSLITHQCVKSRLFAFQGCRETLYNRLSYAAYCAFAPTANLSRIAIHEVENI